MHLATYNFALKYVKNKRVLDFGCGAGYGSQVLAREAASVVAVDISPEAIEYAIKTYPNNNLEFKELTEFISMDEKFDVITSFQVIEHVTKVNDYITKLKNKLKPGGLLIISTPDRSDRLFNIIQKPWNIFHIREYSDVSLQRFLKKYFHDTNILKITSHQDFVKHEILRRKKQRLITLPCTLFFYPNFLRIGLLKSQAWLFKKLKQILKGNDHLSSSEIPDHSFLNYTVEDIQISECPQTSTDLIAVCRLQ